TRITIQTLFRIEKYTVKFSISHPIFEACIQPINILEFSIVYLIQFSIFFVIKIKTFQEFVGNGQRSKIFHIVICSSSSSQFSLFSQRSASSETCPASKLH
ncbi:hypothetical protein Pfo_021970, partial [Paulownia fortunei]